MLARRAMTARRCVAASPATSLGARRGTRAAPHSDCVGNQARLRRLRFQHGPETPTETPTPATGATLAAAPTSVDVWGLAIDRSMCRCKDQVRESIAWANTAAATYAACNRPANATGDAVEACFEAAHPTSTPDASTDSSGRVSLPPASRDPCQRIENKLILVHETMHSRHANDMAGAQGPAFFGAWNALSGDPRRLETLRARFPREVAAFEAQWNSGADWARDEVHSYTWERRFLVDALAALNRLC